MKPPRGKGRSRFSFFLSPGWFPVAGRYLTYPGNKRHVSSDFCNIDHRGVLFVGGGGRDRSTPGILF